MFANLSQIFFIFNFNFDKISSPPTLSHSTILTSLNTATNLYLTKNERYHHQRCPPAQPQKYQRHDPPGSVSGHNGSLRLREIDARVRYALCRRAAAVCRVALLYARQFLGIMQKPDVDSIEGLSPAISIEQKTTSKNPRSTVGTVTEIYDYLRLLYARIACLSVPGTISPSLPGLIYRSARF